MKRRHKAGALQLSGSEDPSPEQGDRNYEYSVGEKGCMVRAFDAIVLNAQYLVYLLVRRLQQKPKKKKTASVKSYCYKPLMMFIQYGS